MNFSRLFEKCRSAKRNVCASVILAFLPCVLFAADPLPLSPAVPFTESALLPPKIKEGRLFYAQAAERPQSLRKKVGDLDAVLQKQNNQKTIDKLRKQLVETLAKGDYEEAYVILSSEWDGILKLTPSQDEINIFADAALDHAAIAFQDVSIIPGGQLVMLAHRISPEDSRVKTWVFASSIAALGLILFLLFLLFWIVARVGMLVETFRYRYRLRDLRKKSLKKGPDPWEKNKS